MARLGDIATLITKGTTPTSIGFNFQKEGINFVKIESVDDKGCFICDKFDHISVECHEKLKRSQLQENDILFSIAGAIGRAAIVKKDILPANTNQALAIMRIPQGVINYSFLLYVLQSSAVLEQAEKKKQGVAQLNLSLKDIGDFVIPDLHLEKQQEIVDNLDKVSTLISLRKQQLSKLDELVKSRFIELFGEPLTLLDGGKTIPLEKVFSEITVGFVGEATSSYVKIGVPYLRTQNVRKGYIDFSGLIYVSEEFHNTNRKSQIKPGDIVVSRVGVNRGMAAVIPQVLEDANIANCLIIKKEATVNSNYLAYYLNTSYGLSPKFGASVGSAQGVINTAILKKWEVFLPPYAQQEQFVAFMQQTDKSKLAVQQSLEKLETLKKALMQKYFG